MVTTARCPFALNAPRRGQAFRPVSALGAFGAVPSLASPLASHARPAAALARFATAAAIAMALAGCSREPSSEVVAEPTPSVPSDVVFYTHVLYGGDDAYLVDGHWFRPAASGWVVFTKEPLELALIRRTLEPARNSTWYGF